MTKRKFYKTKIVIEILSKDKPYDFYGFRGLYYDINDGDYSGDIIEIDNEILNGLGAVHALIKQGSDPEFFNLDKNGNDLEDTAN